MWQPLWTVHALLLQVSIVACLFPPRNSATSFLPTWSRKNFSSLDFENSAFLNFGSFHVSTSDYSLYASFRLIIISASPSWCLSLIMLTVKWNFIEPRLKTKVGPNAQGTHFRSWHQSFRCDPSKRMNKDDDQFTLKIRNSPLQHRSCNCLHERSKVRLAYIDSSTTFTKNINVYNPIVPFVEMQFLIFGKIFQNTFQRENILLSLCRRNKHKLWETCLYGIFRDIELWKYLLFLYLIL